MLFFLILPAGIYAQQTGGSSNHLKYLLDLNVFQTPLEKQLFADIASNKNVDYLSLYLSTPGSASFFRNAKQKIDAYLSVSDLLRQEEFNSRRLKKVYSEIHNSFLSKYVDNPTFGELFETGNYNCATATALYSLLLEKASISYNIRETPQHVYLVAAPETHNIVFETTAPGARVMELNEKAKNQYLEYLYSNKMISREEWNTADKNELFKKYFFNDALISKTELAGILYYNAAVNAMEKEHMKEAYVNFEKAYFLYPCQKIRYFVMISLASLLVEDKMKDDPEAYPYYLRFNDISNRDVSKSIFGNYFESIGKKLLFKNSDPAKYWTVYTTLISHVTDSSLKKDLQYVHYYDVAHYYSIKSKYDSALRYLDSVYAYNRNDLLIQELITNTLFDMMRGITNEKSAFDTLNTIFQRYPFVDKQSKLGEYYMYCLSRVAGLSFDKENKKKETSTSRSFMR